MAHEVAAAISAIVAPFFRRKKSTTIASFENSRGTLAVAPFLLASRFVDFFAAGFRAPFFAFCFAVGAVVFVVAS